MKEIITITVEKLENGESLIQVDAKENYTLHDALMILKLGKKTLLDNATDALSKKKLSESDSMKYLKKVKLSEIIP